MCDERLPSVPCKFKLSHTKPTAGRNKYYCVSYRKGVNRIGQEHLIYCPGHYFPVPLDRFIDSQTNKEEPGLMKELERGSPESPISYPSTSGLEHLELPKKASSDPGIREKCRNIDAICASLASSSAHKSKSVQGLFKAKDQPSSQISVDSQNGSKERPASRGSYISHSSILQQCSSSMSPAHQDPDMEIFADDGKDFNALSTVMEKESACNPTSPDSDSPFSVSIQDVRSLSSAEVPLNSPSSSVVFEEQDSLGSTEDCASACSSTTFIEPGSTGSSTVINSPAASIAPPESPVAIEENSKQGNEICPSPIPKSNQELCNELGLRRCHVPTHLIKLPSHQTHFFKCRSKKYLSILHRSQKEIRRKVVKSDRELCRQYGFRPCQVQIRPLTVVKEPYSAPLTIHYTRNYIAHVIRKGYNEQLHRERVDWYKVYDKYLAGRFVILRREYFEKIAQKNVDNFLKVQEVYEAREKRARLIYKKEAENLLKNCQKEARERRARLIRLKETELLTKKRVYYAERKYVLACSKDFDLYSEAVESAKRLKIMCCDADS